LLADYCLKENPPVWVPAEQSQSELRDIQGRLSEVEEMIRQEENRLEAGLESALVRLDIEEHIAQLLVRRRRLETAAKELVRADQSLNQNFAILTSIIGIGEVSAIRMLALIRFERFERGRQVACFAGVTPKKYESGTSIHKKEHISRRGNTKLREAVLSSHGSYAAQSSATGICRSVTATRQGA
jgi:transposase